MVLLRNSLEKKERDLAVKQYLIEEEIHQNSVTSAGIDKQIKKLSRRSGKDVKKLRSFYVNFLKVTSDLSDLLCMRFCLNRFCV